MDNKHKKILKYLVALLLILIGIGILIGGIVITNTPMIVLGLFTFVIGTIVSFFLYMNP